MKRSRGCGVTGEVATVMGDQRLTTCPRVFIYRNPAAFTRLSQLYALLDKGVLPDAGGYYDQSALTMEALQLYGAGLAEGREYQRSKAGRGKGKGKQTGA